MGFLNPTQDDDYRISAMPGTTDVPGPNAFEGALTAIPKGVVAGVDKVVQVANDAAATDVGSQLFGALTQQPAAFVQNLAREGQDIERSSAALKVVNEWAATGQDPRKTGTVGRIAAGTAEGVTIGLTGAAVAGPWGAAGLLGAAEGYGSYKEGVAQGLDPETAKEQGIVTGMFSAAGALLPMKFGKTALTSIAGGAGSNVALGMMQRKLTSTVLEDNGYHAMAQQTRIADGESMAADAILGAAFGAFGHYTHRANPADVDAAAAVATETHFNRSAPGVPTDPATATLHADTMEASLRALADGDLPDIPPERAQQLVDNVLPDPMHETAQPLHEAAKAELPGFESAAADVPRVELPPMKPAPPWSKLVSQVGFEVGDFFGAFQSDGIRRELPPESAAPARTGVDATGVPLEPFYDDMLGHLVHNYGNEVYEYREVYDYEGRRVEPVTYRQLAEEFQRHRDEAEHFSRLYDVAAACAARHGA